jgi:hypothetical protein
VLSRLGVLYCLLYLFGYHPSSVFNRLVYAGILKPSQSRLMIFESSFVYWWSIVFSREDISVSRYLYSRYPSLGWVLSTQEIKVSCILVGTAYSSTVESRVISSRLSSTVSSCRVKVASIFDFRLLSYYRPVSYLIRHLIYTFLSSICHRLVNTAMNLAILYSIVFFVLFFTEGTCIFRHSVKKLPNSPWSCFYGDNADWREYHRSFISMVPTR